MKIISWNVNGINACARKGLIKFMNKENAVVYCFQELKSSENTLNPGNRALGSSVAGRMWKGRKRGSGSGWDCVAEQPSFTQAGHAPSGSNPP